MDEAGARRYKVAVFDWDGTLMDSAAIIASSIQLACRDLGLPVPSVDEARYVIGLGLDDTMQRLLPWLPRSLYRHLAERYSYHFSTRDHRAQLFEGVQAMLALLAESGYRLAIATGKNRVGLNRVLARSGIESMFIASRCADESKPKPHPAMLLDLMQALGLRPDEGVMIGDTSHDLRMALAAGMDAVAVTYGAHARDELVAHRPVACVDSIEELHAWLMRGA